MNASTAAAQLTAMYVEWLAAHGYTGTILPTEVKAIRQCQLVESMSNALVAPERIDKELAHVRRGNAQRAAVEVQ